MYNPTDDFWTHAAPPWLGDTRTLAEYNAERSRGIVHHPQWVARMAELQAYFDSNISYPTLHIEKPKKHWWNR